jgi:hypothetical protein
MVVTTLALAPELHRRLAVAAVEDNAAINELVREAVRQWLDRRDQARKGRSRR